ncbi:hypothetical protein [Youngiibacter multivorans]|uniref:Nitric oxide reductase activation protein n=1 Tax=Youngiibacter multivorans TaxID=937251 RepID=A0ABS4G081_9CLOT|nr:hypothetical protein [Youngiibacter multivorans]MBP1917953.1 hypothetical protein [Youngiibacter multivorans]
MEDRGSEKTRASNIIWTAAGNYAFKPEMRAYDERGKADIYWNQVIGAAHRYYEFEKIIEFFKTLEGDRSAVIFRNLMWIGIENGTYHKGFEERPAIVSLREAYATKTLGKWEGKDPYDEVDEIEIAHYRKALGLNVEASPLALKILSELEFDASMDTDAIVGRMNRILEGYFEFLPLDENNIKPKRAKRGRELVHLGGRRRLSQGVPFLKRLNIGTAEYNGEIQFGVDETKSGVTLQLLKIRNKWEQDQREYIRSHFGEPLIEGDKTRTLEGMLCTGSHSNCHLHLTRGEFIENEESSQVRKARTRQRESNLKHYDESHARNSNLISKLERRIRNTMLTSMEATKLKSESGSLVIEKVWRNVYLNDDKVFVRTLHEKTMDLCVDIMLDGSASQMSRQESIAAQGYIIAESLTRCGIPVRVFSFCSVRDFLVLSVYRDYDDSRRNKAIFDYTVAGFNRDGLAIRTALHLAGEGRFQNRILIVLTDGDPNDMHGMSISGRLPGRKEYAGPAGVEDAAREVRKGIQSGIAVIGVFTGQDRNVEAAKKIYGHNFARISSPDKFADVVGVLLQNELANMI